jgi:hypothetical protein
VGCALVSGETKKKKNHVPRFPPFSKLFPETSNFPKNNKQDDFISFFPLFQTPPPIPARRPVSTAAETLWRNNHRDKNGKDKCGDPSRWTTKIRAGRWVRTEDGGRPSSFELLMRSQSLPPCEPRKEHEP